MLTLKELEEAFQGNIWNNFEVMERNYWPAFLVDCHQSSYFRFESQHYKQLIEDDYVW